MVLAASTDSSLPISTPIKIASDYMNIFFPTLEMSETDREWTDAFTDDKLKKRRATAAVAGYFEGVLNTAQENLNDVSSEDAKKARSMLDAAKKVLLEQYASDIRDFLILATSPDRGRGDDRPAGATR